MPQILIAIAIGAAAGGVGAAIAGTAILVGIALGGGLALLSVLLSPSLDIGSLRGDVLSTIRVAIAPSRWILGRGRVGAVMVFFHEDDRTLHVAMVLSEGSCDSIERIWIGTDEIEFTREGTTLTPTQEGTIVFGTVIEPADNKNYNGKITFNEYFAGDGAEGQSLRDAVPEEWTDDHRLESKSWVHVRLIQTKYGKKIKRRFWSRIPEITFMVRGIKITWPGQSTPIWTESAAALRYWWLRERRGIPAAAIDEASVMSAHQLCDETINHALPADYSDFEATSKRYSINGIIHSDDGHERVEAEMDFAWQGFATERDGVFYFRPGSDRVVSATIDPDHIANVDSIQPAAAIQDRINAVQIGLAQSREHDWLEFSLPEISDDDALARDGEYLPQDIGKRAFVVDPIAAGRLAATTLRRARASAIFVYTLKASANMQWLSVAPGDWLLINDPEHGLSNFQVMVQTSELRPDWSVTLTMIEQPNGVYADTLILPPLKPRRILRPNTRNLPQVQDLAVTYDFRESRDGSVVWFLVVSFTEAAYRTRIIVEDIADPDNVLLTADVTTSDDTVRIVVDTPSRYRVTAIHLSLDGYASVPVEAEIEFGWSDVPVPLPIIISDEQYGSILQIVSLPVSHRGLKAMEIRYSVGPIDGTDVLTAITEDNWNQVSLAGRVFIDPSTGEQPIVAEFVLPASGRYRLYARFESNLGNYGPIQEIGYKLVLLPLLDTVSDQYWPTWEGAMQNFYLWPHDEEYRLLVDRDDRNAITVAEWNAMPFWPFGYPDDLPDNFDSYFNAQSRWYKTEVIDLRAPVDVEVRYDIEFFHPELMMFAHAVYVAPFDGAITQENKGQVMLVPEDGFIALQNTRYFQAVVLFSDRETPALHRFAFHLGRTG